MFTTRYLGQLFFGLIVASLGVGLSGCTDKSTPWRFQTGSGLQTSNEHPETLLFLNDTIGLLAGSSWQDADLLAKKLATKQVAIMYRTTDGGQSWTKTAYGRGRRFVLATRTAQAAYIVRLNEQHAPAAPVSELLRSADQGRTWKLLSILPGQITQLNFTDAKDGFAITNQTKQGERLIYTTTDGGRTWRPAAWNLPSARRGLYTPDGTAWFLTNTSNSAYHATHLSRVARTNGEVITEAMPQARADTFVSDEVGNLYFPSDDKNGTVRLIRRDAVSGAYTTLHTFRAASPLLADKIEVAGRSLSLLASTSNRQVALNHYRFYHSTDAGRTWQEEELPITYQVQPYYFLNPHRAWLSGGGAQLQIRRPQP